MAAWTEIGRHQQQRVDDAQLLHAVDAALAAAADVDPDSSDGRELAAFHLPMLRLAREAGAPTGQPVDLGSSARVGRRGEAVGSLLEFMQSAAHAAGAEPAQQMEELTALEQRVPVTPADSMIDGICAPLLLALWLQGAETLHEPEAADRAIAWVAEPLWVQAGRRYLNVPTPGDGVRRVCRVFW